jgi:hypothetical protein
VSSFVAQAGNIAAGAWSVQGQNSKSRLEFVRRLSTLAHRFRLAHKEIG